MKRTPIFFSQVLTRVVAKDYPQLLHVWFWDESGFSLRVIRRKRWCKKGQRKNITGQRRRGHEYYQEKMGNLLRVVC